MDEPKDFKELVAWASWEIIKGLTKGEPLERVMHHVLAYTRTWKPANDQTKKTQPR